MSKLEAWRWHRQGLDRQAGSPADCLRDTGWIRSVGGCSPYFGLLRRTGLDRAAVDAALAAVEIHELPAVRGCTYIVGQDDFGLALQAGQSDKDVQMAVKHVGVTPAEVDQLCEGILEALKGGPLDPTDLKTALGDHVRHLGEAGKKRGMTSTLGLGLGRLQGQGRIRRLSSNGRLDNQRYSYARWDRDWQPIPNLAEELARRFFRWAGPAPLAPFCTWTGYSQKAAKACLGGLVETPEGWMLAEDAEAYAAFQAPDQPDYALLGSLDNLFHLQRIAGQSDGLGELESNGIAERGRLVGLWDYDPSEGRIVWKTFEKADKALKAEVERVETYVREQLGDARTFSLDSPESRKARLAKLR